MVKAMIKANDLIMDYDERTRAIDRIDMEVMEGEWVTVMGASGSGKTTLMNILGCLDRPTSGVVTLRNTDVTKLDNKDLTRFRRESFGFIFQQFHLVPYLTALENVMLSQYFVNGRGQGEDKAREVLEKVGLGHRLDHTPSHLSGGEQQRVAVARALVNEPEIIMADEPTGNLDQANGKIILDLLKDLNNEGHTIVLITHEPSIGHLGDRIVHMVDGRVGRIEKINEN